MENSWIVNQIDAQIAKLQQAKRLLQNAESARRQTSVGRPGEGVATSVASRKRVRRKLSAEAKAKIAAAQKARWARAKKAS